MTSNFTDANIPASLSELARPGTEAREEPASFWYRAKDYFLHLRRRQIILRMPSPPTESSV